MQAHTDGRGCKILLAAHQGGPAVSRADPADISLEKGESFSNKVKQGARSVIILDRYFWESDPIKL